MEKTNLRCWDRKFFYLRIMDRVQQSVERTTFRLAIAYKYRKNGYQKYTLLNKLLILVFVLFGFTGGTYFNLRVFSIYTTLIYANIVQNGGNYEKHHKEDIT